MLNLKFLRKYILKKQKYTKYVSEQLDNLKEQELKDIIHAMIGMNRMDRM